MLSIRRKRRVEQKSSVSFSRRRMLAAVGLLGLMPRRVLSQEVYDKFFIYESKRRTLDAELLLYIFTSGKTVGAQQLYYPLGYEIKTLIEADDFSAKHSNLSEYLTRLPTECRWHLEMSNRQVNENHGYSNKRITAPSKYQEVFFWARDVQFELSVANSPVAMRTEYFDSDGLPLPEIIDGVNLEDEAARQEALERWTGAFQGEHLHACVYAKKSETADEVRLFKVKLRIRAALLQALKSYAELRDIGLRKIRSGEVEEYIPDFYYGCFLTTACCSYLGLPDNCWELQTLRYFRDHYLLKQDGGLEDVQQYYECAPQVCEAIHASAQRSRELSSLYLLLILPCCLLASLRLNHFCRMYYSAYARRLFKKFGIQAGV